MEWITQNHIFIFVIGIILISLLVLLYRNKKGLLYKAALYAVTKAEYAFGSNTGKIKFAQVYTYLKKEYPIVTFFFTEKQLTDIIETALTQMKEILATKQAKIESLKQEQLPTRTMF